MSKGFGSGNLVHASFGVTRADQRRARLNSYPVSLRRLTLAHTLPGGRAYPHQPPWSVLIRLVAFPFPYTPCSVPSRLFASPVPTLVFPVASLRGQCNAVRMMHSFIQPGMTGGHLSWRGWQPGRRSRIPIPSLRFGRLGLAWNPPLSSGGYNLLTGELLAGGPTCLTVLCIII